MAATGFFYTFTRPRTSLPMSMLKYDPIGEALPLLFPFPFLRVLGGLGGFEWTCEVPVCEGARFGTWEEG